MGSSHASRYTHTLREGRARGQDRPLEGAPDHQSNQLLAWNQDSLPASWGGRKGRSDPWCHWERRPEKGKQFSHMVCLHFFFFNNIEQDQTVLPVGRSRCASHADEVYCQTYTNLAASEEYGFVSCDTHSSLSSSVFRAEFHTHFSLVQPHVVHTSINIDFFFFLLFRAERSHLYPVLNRFQCCT